MTADLEVGTSLKKKTAKFLQKNPFSGATYAANSTSNALIYAKTATLAIATQAVPMMTYFGV
jgi:hypothetical protein